MDRGLPATLLVPARMDLCSTSTAPLCHALSSSQFPSGPPFSARWQLRRTSTVSSLLSGARPSSLAAPSPACHRPASGRALVGSNLTSSQQEEPPTRPKSRQSRGHNSRPLTCWGKPLLLAYGSRKSAPLATKAPLGVNRAGETLPPLHPRRRIPFNRPLDTTTYINGANGRFRITSDPLHGGKPCRRSRGRCGRSLDCRSTTSAPSPSVSSRASPRPFFAGHPFASAG